MRLLRYEDEICAAPAAPLADLRHELVECQRVKAPTVRLQKMEQEEEGMIGSLRPLGDGAQECIDSLLKANALLAAQDEPAAD